MGPRGGLDRCRKSHLHRDSIPRPSSPPVAILTTLPGTHLIIGEALIIREIFLFTLIPGLFRFNFTFTANILKFLPCLFYFSLVI